MMKYEPYYFVMSRRHVRHYHEGVSVAVPSAAFCLAAVALAALSAALMWRSPKDPGPQLKAKVWRADGGWAGGTGRASSSTS